jgi:hypothetical protein
LVESAEHRVVLQTLSEWIFSPVPEHVVQWLMDEIIL